MKHILAHHNTVPILVLLFSDSLFFSVTNPQKVASWLLIVGILLFLASLYYVMLGALAAAKWYGLPTGRHPQRLAKVLIGLIGFLVALQSIGELSSRDIFVLLPLALIAYPYSYRAWGRGRDEAHV